MKMANKLTKLEHLQGLRGLAILSVISFHYFPTYFPNGYLGVDLFFVLSGYLMSMMLDRHPEVTPPIFIEFLYCRMKRIVSLYYFVLFFTIFTSEDAIWLVTNINWYKNIDYFEKLGVSHDLFTHTWSLCLEIQFYLVFPFIWAFQTRFGFNKRILFLQLLSAGSFLFYSTSGEKRAFNNMFCRMWQFLFGNLIFCLQQNEHPMDDLEKLQLIDAEEEEPTKEGKSVYSMFASLSLALLIYTMVTEQHLTKDHSRMTITIATTLLIFFGKNFSLLENKAMVFIGEISYAWYLIHWPMLGVQNFHNRNRNEELFIGMICSFLLALLVHFIFEKKYLSYGKNTIFMIVSTLFWAHWPPSWSFDIQLIRCVQSVLGKSCRKILEERKAYNYRITQYDSYLILNEGCVFEDHLFSKNYMQFEGSCKFTSNKTKNEKTIAIIGNSWSANNSPLIFEECSPFFGSFYRTSFVVLMLEPAYKEICEEKEKHYFSLVERVNPDYLFIVTRYCFLNYRKEPKQWEAIVEEGKRRLARLSAYVKQKIFVIHTFPEIYLNETQLIAAIDEEIEPQWNASIAHNVDVGVAQEKLDEMVTNCPKCEQFDFTSQFIFNGSFLPYDPESYVTFYTPGSHLTIPGLERVRPVYREICRRIGQ